MIKTLYKPKRRRNGKRVVSRLYSARIRVDGERRISQIALGVSDRQVAEEKARKIVQEREKERVGLLPPKIQRDAAQCSLTKHIQDFVGDLRTKGPNARYVKEMEFKLTTLADECGWRLIGDVSADSFVQWRNKQTKAKKTLNEYLSAAKGLLNWMVKQRLTAANGLEAVGHVETRGNEVLRRRAYTNAQMSALLKVAGKERVLYMMAALTGIRHGEFKKLRWGDINLSAENASVTVRASVSKNHKQACLPLHRILREELLAYRPANVSGGEFVFGGVVPRSKLFRKHLQAAGIPKKDSEGRVVDFHSFRHTLCTNLHLAGVPLREAMELMRHSDVRLILHIYADTSLFALRPAVEKLPCNYSNDDAQRDAQRNGASRLLPSLSGTDEAGLEMKESPIDTGLSALAGVLCHQATQKPKKVEMVGAAGFEPATYSV
jgi:integrase